MSTRINGLFPGEVKPTDTVGGCIDIFEGLWPNPDETIEQVEQLVRKEDTDVFWRRATTYGHGEMQDIRTNKTFDLTHFSNITNNGLVQNIHNQFYIMLLAASVPYAMKYGIHEELWHDDYNLLKYSPGEYYKAHYDGSTSLGRCISAICYLNDNYEGGEIEFVNFNVKIKPRPGTLILFPSNYAYTHVAHPVTSGKKYALVTWIKDRQT